MGNIIGVDLGGTNIEAGTILDGQVLKSYKVGTQAAVGGKRTMDLLKKVISDLMTDETEAIGIGVPSVVDRKNGIVYIQTYSPNNYSIECAKNHDYISFYNKEIENRKAPLNYPPFSRLIRLVIRGIDEKKVEDDANKIADMLRMETYNDSDKIIILGATACAMSKLNKYYRWNILIKTPSHSLLKNFFNKLNSSFTVDKGNYIEIDIDPINML